MSPWCLQCKTLPRSAFLRASVTCSEISRQKPVVCQTKTVEFRRQESFIVFISVDPFYTHRQSRPGKFTLLTLNNPPLISKIQFPLPVGKIHLQGYGRGVKCGAHASCDTC